MGCQVFDTVLHTSAPDSLYYVLYLVSILTPMFKDSVHLIAHFDSPSKYDKPFEC